MKKSIILSAIMLMVSGAAAAQQDATKPVIIPAKTDIFITLTSRITTKTAAAGDRFTAQVAVPVTLNDEIVIPVGSYLIGRVGHAERAGRMKGKAELEIRFETVILPSGITRNFQAVLQSAEGQDSNKIDETTGTIQGTGNQGGEAAKTAGTVAVTGAGIGAIAGRDWKSVGVGGAIGAAAGALFGTAQRGPDIVLEKGSQISVSLYQDVSLVKPEPQGPKNTIRP